MANSSNFFNRITPLYESDPCELNQSEISYWTYKLKITPTELFRFSDDQLRHKFNRIQQQETAAKRCNLRKEKFDRLITMRRQLFGQPRADHFGDVDTILKKCNSISAELNGMAPTLNRAATRKLIKEEEATRRAAEIVALKKEFEADSQEEEEASQAVASKKKNMKTRRGFQSRNN